VGEFKNKTDTSRYHGGDLADELAALISLTLGICPKAGGERRIFEPDRDVLGRLNVLQDATEIVVPRSRVIHPLVPDKALLNDTGLVQS
jgi:hypothetical protein